MNATSEVMTDLRSWQSKRAAYESYKAHTRFIGQMAGEAAKLNVHSHQKALAVMVSKLAGLTLTRVIGEPDANDAAMLADDLRDTAKIVDEFVAALGSYAASNLNGIDEKMFVNVLSDAVDGNALYEIETAGERLTEELQAAE